MLKNLRWILSAVAIVVAMVLPDVSYAQLDAAAMARAQRNGENTNIYGSTIPGMEGTGMEGEEGMEDADTTATKKKRERKPLESYYFTDTVRALPNWKWNVDRYYNRVNIMPLDTTLSDWRIDYVFYRKGVGDMALGGLGQSSQPVNWFDRSQDRDFTFARGYDAYTARIENVPFYNSKKPLTNLTYLESGQKRYREEHFELVHSQNITPSLSANVSYKARSTMGRYDWQRTKNHALSVGAAYTGKRYSVHAAYMNNMVDTRENGGVVGEWAIADTVFEMPSGVPMRLASSEAHNNYRNHSVFVKQAYAIPFERVTEYDFSIADLSAMYIGHQFEYSSWSKVYTDKKGTYSNERGNYNEETGKWEELKDQEYYEDWFINPETTRDSISERLISNKIFVQVQPWDRYGAVSTIDGGVGFDIHTYSYMRLKDYVRGNMTRDKRTSWYIYGAASGMIKRYADWRADVKYHPSGYRGGDLSVGAEITLRAFIREHPLILTGRFRQELRSPSYWHENLFSNHYVWFNSFGKESETRFEVSFSVPDIALELGAWQGVVKNMIYYGNDSRVAQNPGIVSLTSLYARKDFRIAGFHLDHRALVQITSDEHVLPVPTFSAYLSYYYEFWVKRDVLRVQVGLDGRFNTAYYAPGYNPALSAFYNQREVKIGNYPYIDAFISAKWKRMRILLKVQHLNMNLFGNGEYFQVARYPLNPRMFKLGISWSFYD
ncbi:MAG: putative porin [Alistipes sp.]|nr:putative porin [Alistipes sp.]